MYIDKTTTTPNPLTEVTQTDSTLTTTEITNSIPTTTEIDLENFETKTMKTMNVERTTTTASVNKTNDSNETGLNKGPRVGENNITDTYPRTTVGLDDNEFSSSIDDNNTTTTESSDLQTTQSSTDYVTVLTTFSDKDNEPDFTRSDSVITTKSTQLPKNQTSTVTSTEPITTLTDVITTTTEPDVTTEPISVIQTTTPVTTVSSLTNRTTTAKDVPTTKSVNMQFPSSTESDDSFRMMDTTKSVDGTTNSENTRKTTRFDTSLEHHDEQTTKTAIGETTTTTDPSTLLTTNEPIARTELSIIDSVTHAITQKCNRTSDCTAKEQCVDGRCTKGILINLFLSIVNEKPNFD